MQQHLVLTLGEVVEQTRLCKAVGLEVVPRHISQVTFVKVDVQDTDDGTRLVFLVSYLFVNLSDLKK